MKRRCSAGGLTCHQLDRKELGVEGELQKEETKGKETQGLNGVKEEDLTRKKELEEEELKLPESE